MMFTSVGLPRPKALLPFMWPIEDWDGSPLSWWPRIHRIAAGLKTVGRTNKRSIPLP
jgi:hypothetical protein